jgi:hypothetical protein
VPTSAAHVPIAPPRATALTAELADLDLDPTSLPKFADLTPKQLRGVMQLFRKSLGVKCTDCHDADYSAPTRRKSIAQHMWDDITANISTSDNGAVFCDSCHQGRVSIVDRGDLGALKDDMKSSFVDKLARKDGQVNACSTCHVSDADFDLIDRWGGPFGGVPPAQ